MPDVRSSPPGERTRFVGRARELAEIGEIFAEGTRLLTLLGPPGMGKTRLAQRYASVHRERGGGDSLFCDLSECRSLEAALLAVAVTVGVQPVAETATPAWIEEVGHQLAQRSGLLVILDNAEQVSAAVADLAGRWIDAAPQVCWLTTSRQRLHIEGEACLELPPLADTEAVDLFVERARAVDRAFALPDPVRPIVVELVRRLDSVPLAIELAAARSDVLSPAQLLERLGARLELLKTQRRDVSARHATLRQAIDWSWDLLTDVERRALSQCSVFRGGFTLAAADAVLELGPTSPAAVDVLTMLRDKSLLRRVDAEAAEPRLALYESIREYACERLLELGHAEVTMRRHARWFLAAAERKGQSSADGEAENLFAVVQNVRLLDARSAAQAALILDRRLAGRTPRPLLQQVHDDGLDAAMRADDATLVVRMRIARADANLAVGALAPAETELAAAMERARAAEDRRLEAEVHLASARLGILAGMQQDDERSRTHGTLALALACELGDAGLEARSRLHLALVQHRLRELSTARTGYQAALALSRTAGDRALEAQILGYLGELDQYQGAAEARSRYQAALAIHRALGNRRLEAQVLGTLGSLHHDRGEPEEALAAYEESLAIFRQLGIRRLEAWLLPAVASLETELGRFEAASERCRIALDIARQVGLLRVEAHACAQAAVIEHALGRSERAMALARQSLEAAGGTADRHLRAFALAHLGALEAGCGRIEEATCAFRSARETLDAELIRAIVDVLEGFADLAAARQARRAGDLAEHGRLVSHASERVTAAAGEGGTERAPSGSSPASRWADVRVAVQLLERALAAHAQSTGAAQAREGSPPPRDVAAEASELPSDGLVVGVDGRWLRVSGGKIVDLSRYQAVRRILVVLARTRIASPGVALPVEALVEAGWPGEAMRAGSGAERVYTSIRVLRKLGLTDVLLRRDDGYLIDPRVNVVCAAT